MKNKKKRKPISYRGKYILYSILMYALLFLPLGIIIGINFKSYFFHYEGWKISMGAIITLLCVIGLISKKAEFLKGTWGFGILFIVSYLLRPIIYDVVLISGAVFIGKVLSNIVEYKVKRYKRLSEKKEEADINAEAYQEKMRELREEKERELREIEETSAVLSGRI